jgi:Calcineurin-like phosphoesterase
MVVALLVAVVAVPTVLAASAGRGSQPPAPTAPGRFPDPPALASATVWAVGDGAKYSEGALSVARLIEGARPTRFVYLGDVYERGSAAEFAANYQTVYGPLRAITLPTPGNHDWPLHTTGYDPYWARVIGGRPPPYYDVSLAGWQLISLNSETDHSSGSPQIRWLRGRVAGPGSCRIAFWHRPRYSAGTHGDQPDVQPFWDALIGRAALVLNGHDHDMQRLSPHHGITELVSGAGGRSHYPVASDPRLAFSNDQQYGALRLRLSPGVARYAFVSAAGRVLDSGVTRCRIPPPHP